MSYPLEYMAASEWNEASRDFRRLALAKLNENMNYENDVWAKLPPKLRFKLWGFIAGRATKRLQDDLT